MTAPVEKIDSVNISYQTEKFVASIIFLLISGSIMLFVSQLPTGLGIPVVILSLILMLASLIFIISSYNSYSDLVVLVTGRRVTLMSTSMTQKGYLEKLSGKISEAIVDEQKYRELKSQGNAVNSPQLNASETMKLKMVLEDYEELKKMKKQLIDSGSKGKTNKK